MLTVQKLYDDLDYWIHIGIGDDIINIPEHRPEYQHIVNKYKFTDDALVIQMSVLKELQDELKKPWYLRPTFWVLIWLKIKKSIFR